MRKIMKFLENNAHRTESEIVKRLIKKFKLDSKEAEEIYKVWKKEYMKFKG